MSVDRLLLFGILYAASAIDSANGNQAKALAFYHLVHNEDIIANVKRNSKKLKLLVYCMLELAQAQLRTDPDDRQRVYFREPAADFNDRSEQTYRQLLAWLYQEFQRQIFGSRSEISCIMFIERISCKFSKNKDPNKLPDVEEDSLHQNSGQGGRGNNDGERTLPNNRADGNDADDEERRHLVPSILKTAGLNDWFDPVFLQSRIELLKRHNQIESEDGSDRGDAFSAAGTLRE